MILSERTMNDGIATQPRLAKASKASDKRPMYRVALLGTGYIADWHAKALTSIRNVQLVAACDQKLDRARALAEKFDVPRVYSSLENLLAEEKLDSVHVLLPPDHHFQAAKAILTANVNVLLEKPMCVRSEESEALVRLAESRRLKIGIGHNFLFADCYERLRRDVASGVIGRLDHLTITWHRELPQLTHGPFDIWMLRDPRNIMLEIGAHCAAQMLDLVGSPEDIEVRANNQIDLPSGVRFFRRWQVSTLIGRTAVDLRFSFVPGFDEFTLHARGSLASATVDFDRNTYSLLRHRAFSEDFDRYAIVTERARSLRGQARRTVRNYALAKLHLGGRGNPYEASIAKVMDAFYAGPGQSDDQRIRGQAGAEVIRICERIMASAVIEGNSEKPPPNKFEPASTTTPSILVLGATGFIGQELVRQLIKDGRPVRLLVRNLSKLPIELKAAGVECQRGDLTSEEDLRRAMTGIKLVFHLGRAQVKDWADYQRLEIGVTRQIAAIALEAGVKRFIYTGTIDSYYAGARAGTITEETPLDPRIARRNLYAQAKAASEELLSHMYREKGLPVVIVRPGIVIGRGGSPFHWGVGMWWYNSICEIWGNGRNKLPLVLVQDVAKGLIAACDTPGIEGESFNLVGDPCLSAQDYLDELDRCGKIRIQRRATSILKFYLADLFKWSVKVLVRHPERRIPSYRDWESRRQVAIFDCSRAKHRLNWQPAADRSDLIHRGIDEPLIEAIR
jgi:predicted dehydrogenase/nucleoside-diphosphate-sugar epimerase